MQQDDVGFGVNAEDAEVLAVQREFDPPVPASVSHRSGGIRDAG